MQLELPRRMAAFNRRVVNPVQMRYAWLVPPWAVICHRGRRSGRPHRTPVLAYRSGDQLAVVVLYGERSDWVQNVLAAGGQVIRAGRTHELLDPRLCAPQDVPDAPLAARATGRLSGKLLVARLG